MPINRFKINDHLFVGILTLILAVASFLYSWNNEEFSYTTFDTVYTAKWTETHGKRKHIEYMGRFEGVHNGVPFKYDGQIGGYTYNHVPIGTRYDLRIRPIDLDRSSFLPSIIMAFVGAIGLISGLGSLWSFGMWFVYLWNKRFGKEDNSDDN